MLTLLFSTMAVCIQFCRVTELDRCGQAALKCWHKMLPNENMQKETSSSTVRTVNGPRETRNLSV